MLDTEATFPKIDFSNSLGLCDERREAVKAKQAMDETIGNFMMELGATGKECNQCTLVAYIALNWL
jgi:hypothetical protein